MLSHSAASPGGMASLTLLGLRCAVPSLHGRPARFVYVDARRGASAQGGDSAPKCMAGCQR